jgi:hypothetical protein
LELQWYAIKCLIEHPGLSGKPDALVYEDRIVVFHALDLDDAIERAEREVADYVGRTGARYVGCRTAFRIDAATIEEGTEVYSALIPSEVIGRYYDVP